MVPHIPGAVILDIRPAYRQFIKEANPFLIGTDVKPEAIIEEIWEAFFDKDTVDDRLLDTVCDIGRRSIFERANNDSESFVHVLTDFAQVMQARLESHRLYDGRGYLPFNIEVEPDGLIVLKRDDHLDQIQQEWDKGQEEVEENPDDLEYLDE